MESSQKVLFDLLYQRYAAPVYTYLSHQIEDYDELADLFQETFLRVWRAGSAIPEEEKSQRAYIYTIATNICIDARRKKNRQKKLLQVWQEQQLQQRQSFSEREEDVIWQQTIHMALAELPPRLAACLHLYCIDGFKQREIAPMLGISEKSVSAYLSRAREYFRRIYSRLLMANEESQKKDAIQ